LKTAKTIRFEISNNSPIFDSIQFEMKKHYLHSTNKYTTLHVSKGGRFFAKI